MNNFTPRAQQVLALARKEADRFNHNYVGTEHLLLGPDQAGAGRCGQRSAEDGSRPGDGADGGREAGRLRPGDENGRQHSLHAACEEGARARGQGSESAQSFLCRHRAYFAWTCCAKVKAWRREC